LDGMGELLSQSQKDWTKAKLKEETISLLKLRAMDWDEEYLRTSRYPTDRFML